MRQLCWLIMAGMLSSAPAPIQAAPHQLLLGAYVPNDPWIGLPAAIERHVQPFDAWAGKSISLLGTFVPLDDPNSNNIVLCELRTISQNGYTPFVNIETHRPIEELAAAAGQNSPADADIARLFQALAQWQKKYPDRILLLAPLPEMNTQNPGVAYRGHPQTFQLAWHHLREMGRAAGLDDKVRWVFAPNGYPDKGEDRFEEFYPGGAAVDLVGFSAYNAGYYISPASAKRVSKWENPEEIFEPLVGRMRVTAPHKPIIVAQTGTTSKVLQADGSLADSSERKNAWIAAAYRYFLDTPDITAVLYFNVNKENEGGAERDWTIWNPDSGAKYSSYPAAVADGNIVYAAPSQLSVNWP